MKRLLQFAIFLVLADQVLAQTITVDWSTAQQSIDGFGASAVGITLNSGMPSKELDAFFRTDTGIGLSIVRADINPTVADCQAQYAIPGYGYNATCLTSSGGTTTERTLATMQGAAARASDIKFFATQWSPDGPYKSNGSFQTGGSIIESSSNFKAIANEIAQFVTLMGNNGITLYAVGPQNEPDKSETYPSCTWTAAQLSDFVPYLYSALDGSTGIMLADGSGWANTYFNTAMSNYPSDIATISAHGYSTSNPSQLSINNWTTQHVWMTEDSSSSSTFDGSMSNALTWAQTIHNYLVNAQVSAWVWWYFSAEMYQDDACNDDSPLMDCNGNMAKRGYMTGNWSKFVRPGWHRVGVAYSGSLLVTAFENAAGTQCAIVVVNTSSSAVSNQAFSVGSQMGGQAVPWLTDATYNLAQQSAVSISGGSFSYTIPASSIVTFQGGTPPDPPTNVSAVAH